MDQESFRKLLGSGSNRIQPRAPILPVRGSSAAKIQPVEDNNVFKPRKAAAKTAAPKKFRDRAAERREGISDYADVESVLEDFKSRAADQDSTNGPKGLDFDLLEKSKAQQDAITSLELDDELEQAFHAASSSSQLLAPLTLADASISTNRKKLTKEEIIAQLKRKREESGEGASASPTIEKAEDPNALDKAKKLGKFRPIGAPPQTTSSAGEEKRKKKKRKVQITDIPSIASTSKSEGIPTAAPPPEPTPHAFVPKTTTPNPPISPASVPTPPPPLPLSDPDDDMDIFADAGDYEGIALDDSDAPSDGEVDDSKPIPTPNTTIDDGLLRTNWFGEPIEEKVVSVPVSEDKGKEKGSGDPASPNGASSREAQTSQAEDTTSTRLQPLISSSVPSIKDILARDVEAEREEKRKARKEKLKKKKKGGDDSD